MVSFALNGKPVSVDADPKTPLLWVIRDHVGLTGTKYGCGAGLCGACTVHVDGRRVRSCQTPVSAVEGKKVVTIEGLSPNSSHPLQKAWIAGEVPQCGYCQSGQIMKAAELLASNPEADPRRRSSPTWTATSAAAAPITASSPRSSARRGRAEAMTITIKITEDLPPRRARRLGGMSFCLALGTDGVAPGVARRRPIRWPTPR